MSHEQSRKTWAESIDRIWLHPTGDVTFDDGCDDHQSGVFGWSDLLEFISIVLLISPISRPYFKNLKYNIPLKKKTVISLSANDLWRICQTHILVRVLEMRTSRRPAVVLFDLETTSMDLYWGRGICVMIVVLIYYFKHPLYLRTKNERTLLH